jgi:hypothetical protein
MNNRHMDGFDYANTADQRDREFEELLCLAYLFTHSVYDESPCGSEIPQADNAMPYANYLCS